MEEAAFLCDTVALLNDGVIVDHDTPDELCRRYNYQRQLLLHLADEKNISLPQSGSSAESIYALLKEVEGHTEKQNCPNSNNSFSRLLISFLAYLVLFSAHFSVWKRDLLPQSQNFPFP